MKIKLFLISAFKHIFYLIILFGLLNPGGLHADKEKILFTAEDMLEIGSFVRDSRPTISPTSDMIAYGTVDISEETNILARRPTGFLWIVPTNTGKAKLLLQKGVHGEMPVWSPDGKQLAFFYKGPDGWRLAVWNKITESIKDMGKPFETRNYLKPQWDKTGKRIVYSIPVKEKKLSNPSRVQEIKSSDERIPGDWFFVNKQKASLAIIDVHTGKKIDLLPDPIYLRSFTVSPDARNLIYTAPNPESFAVIRKEYNETFVVSLNGGTPRKVMTSNKHQRFMWAPDGKQLLFLEKGKLMTIPPQEGEAKPFLKKVEISLNTPIWSPDGNFFVCLTRGNKLKDSKISPPRQEMYTIARPHQDLYLISCKNSKAYNITASIKNNVHSPIWSRDGKSIIFKVTDITTYDETLYGFSPKDQKLKVLKQGKESYNLIGETPDNLIVTIQDATCPQDIWLLNTKNGEKKQLTQLNPQLTKFYFSKPELFSFSNADGEKLGALLYKPVDYKPGQRVPVITYVYEKLTPGIHRFNARHQIILNHGYAMLLPDVKIKNGAPGTSFAKCVIPAVNAVRAMNFTNEKFGIWGGSFGGYATAYVITQTDIFACAVSRATPPELFRNWASGRDRDSYNIVSGQARMGVNPFEDRERYIAQSPFFHLDKVNTPVLIMHGVKDYTILFGEGEMMFYALRQLGKVATFVIYNYGDHSLSRHSRVDTLDVIHRMLDWFDKYLKVEIAQK